MRPGEEFYQPVLRAGNTVRVAVESANRDSVGVLAGPADGVVVREDGADREFDGLLVGQRTGMQVLPLDQLMETLWGYWFDPFCEMVVNMSDGEVIGMPVGPGVGMQSSDCLRQVHSRQCSGTSINRGAW